MPLYLKIAIVNCRGICDYAKRLAFFTLAKTLDVHVLCLQETYSKPQDELVWQNDWGDKNQAVFNSNAEIRRKTDAGTAILLKYSSLQFGNIRKNSGGKILTAENDAIALFFKWSMSMPTILPIQNKKGKDSSISFMISPT